MQAEDGTHAFTSLSTIGILPFANCFFAYRPAV
jgi:hypothetical protein